MAMKSEEAVSATGPDTLPNPAAAPPSYESMFGRVQQMKNESNSSVDFCMKCTRKSCQSNAMYVIRGVAVCVCIANIVIGGGFLRQCPNSYVVPIFLLVHGLATIISIAMDVSERHFAKRRGLTTEEIQKNKPQPAACFQQILLMFLFFFFIYGTVISIGNFQSRDAVQPIQINDTNSTRVNRYCNPVVTYYAFSFVTIVLGTIALIFVGSCIFGWVNWLIGTKK